MVQPTVAQISFYFGPDFISFAHAHTVPASRLSSLHQGRLLTFSCTSPSHIINCSSICVLLLFFLKDAHRSLSTCTPC